MAVLLIETKLALILINIIKIEHRFHRSHVSLLLLLALQPFFKKQKNSVQLLTTIFYLYNFVRLQIGPILSNSVHQSLVTFLQVYKCFIGFASTHFSLDHRFQPSMVAERDVNIKCHQNKSSRRRQ